MSEQTATDKIIVEPKRYDGEFQKLFPIYHYEMISTTDRVIPVFTVGDSVCSQAYLQYEKTLRCLEAAVDFLRQCKQNETANGISSQISDRLFDIQDRCIQTYDAFVDLLNDLNIEQN